MQWFLNVITSPTTTGPKLMKTPECWRPSRIVPSLSVFLPYRPSDIHSYTCTYTYIVKISKSRKSRFSKWRPWPMTYNLDLLTRLRYYHRQASHRILGSYLKWFSRESADRQTHTLTDWTYFIASTAGAWGKNLLPVWAFSIGYWMIYYHNILIFHRGIISLWSWLGKSWNLGWQEHERWLTAAKSN